MVLVEAPRCGPADSCPAPSKEFHSDQGGDPILDLSRPKGVSLESQREAIQTIRDLNLSALAESGDQEIATQVSSYEMAYKMQSSGPELIDFGKESERNT